MIFRANAHIIDTKATRLLFSILNYNFLIRNLEERDYGIDLTIERFNDDKPTGNFALFQVKGTDDAFITVRKNNTSLIKLPKFPVKTIEYALLFKMPFFAIYVSNRDKLAYFLHLQKYAELILNMQKKNWRMASSVTLFFPVENELSKNSDKLIEILEKDNYKRIVYSVAEIYFELKFHLESIFASQYDVSDYCCDCCLRLRNMKDFFDSYNILDDEDSSEIKTDDMISVLKRIRVQKICTKEDKKFLEAQVEKIYDLIFIAMNVEKNTFYDFEY